MTHYIHTLLFMCPECAAPIAISDICPEKNLEIVDAKIFRIVCAQCGNATQVPGVVARARWVNEWSLVRGAAAGE